MEKEYFNLVKEKKEELEKVTFDDLNFLTNYELVVPAAGVAGLANKYYTKKFRLYNSNFNRYSTFGVNFMVAVFLLKNLKPLLTRESQLKKEEAA